MSLDESWLLFEPSLTPTQRKLREAAGILKRLGFSGAQANESAAYTLLALLDLDVDKPWSEASAPLIGITPIIKFIHKAYGLEKAPNTRETIRDEAVKYFAEYGLLLVNPDDPGRATNSMKFAYQVEENALKMFRSFKTKEWQTNLDAYIAKLASIKMQIDREREVRRIPVLLPSGESVSLSPGGQNPLIAAIIRDFCGQYVQDGVVLYLGDAEDKFKHLQTKELEALGITVPAPAKMPDVVVHDRARNWLLLIEAVSSGGHIDGKRLVELKRLFQGSTAGLVFISAFKDRADFRKYLPTISWETEVWIADSPEHLIHFNGERFLGPYPGAKE